jgi:hypothetical protein
MNVDGSVPTSLLFTSGSGSVTSPSPESHQHRDETSLDRFVRTSAVIRTLSQSEQRRKEDELRRLEETRDERAMEESEVTDLQPLPAQDEPLRPEAGEHQLA